MLETSRVSHEQQQFLLRALRTLCSAVWGICFSCTQRSCDAVCVWAAWNTHGLSQDDDATEDCITLVKQTDISSLCNTNTQSTNWGSSCIRKLFTTCLVLHIQMLSVIWEPAHVYKSAAAGQTTEPPSLQRPQSSILFRGSSAVC